MNWVKSYERYHNQEFKSKKGNRVIVCKENAKRVQLTVINPENETAQLHVMERGEFEKAIAEGNMVYVKTGYFNCMA